MIRILTLLGLGVGLTCSGQTFLVVPTTNAIPGSGTETMNAVIAAAGNEDMGLQIAFALGAGTQTGNITATLQQSVDATNWCAFYTWAIAANGTNTVAGVTNLAVKGVPYIRITTIANGNTTNLTGLVVCRYLKDLIR